MNKARRVREALGLTPTEAGALLFGYEGKRAHDQWTQFMGSNKTARQSAGQISVDILKTKSVPLTVRRDNWLCFRFITPQASGGFLRPPELCAIYLKKT